MVDGMQGFVCAASSRTVLNCNFTLKWEKKYLGTKELLYFHPMLPQLYLSLPFASVSSLLENRLCHSCLKWSQQKWWVYLTQCLAPGREMLDCSWVWGMGQPQASSPCLRRTAIVISQLTSKSRGVTDLVCWLRVWETSRHLTSFFSWLDVRKLDPRVIPKAGSASLWPLRFQHLLFPFKN